jgi:hypothetical protein
MTEMMPDPGQDVSTRGYQDAARLAYALHESSAMPGAMLHEIALLIAQGSAALAEDMASDHASGACDREYYGADIAQTEGR